MYYFTLMSNYFSLNLNEKMNCPYINLIRDWNLVSGLLKVSYIIWLGLLHTSTAMRMIVTIKQKEGLRLISFNWSLGPFSDKMHPTYFHVQNFGSKAILFHFLSTSGGSPAGLNGPYAFRHNCSSVLKKKSPSWY